MGKEDIYQPGDIVKLKSGGPRMTVKGYFRLFGQPDTVECQWFVGGKLNYGKFAEDSLDRVPDDEDL